MGVMSQHPVNLGLRFVLEVVAVVGLIRLGDGVWGWLLALAGVVAWGIFRVPNDGTSSGRAPVAVPGPVRLAVEVSVFGLGLVGWFLSGPQWVAVADAIALGLHHVFSVDRLRWLLGGTG